jgi:hypothetical protein
MHLDCFRFVDSRRQQVVDNRVGSISWWVGLTGSFGVLRLSAGEARGCAEKLPTFDRTPAEALRQSKGARETPRRLADTH